MHHQPLRFDMEICLGFKEIIPEPYLKVDLLINYHVIIRYYELFIILEIKQLWKKKIILSS